MGELTELLQVLRDGQDGTGRDANGESETGQDGTGQRGIGQGGIGQGGAGDPALAQIFELTYRELRDLAHRRLRRASPITVLDTTALVHECYLRLVRLGRLHARDHSHFLAYAARVMRSIVVDTIRSRLAQRRGGGDLHVTLGTDIADGAAANEQQVLRVDEALQELARLDERLVKVVEMRYFAGLTPEEIATTLGVTSRTVRRDWEKARLLLFAALQDKPA
jgi:RNA polymerase sigma factor (TIGR02999 family)